MDSLDPDLIARICVALFVGAFVAVFFYDFGDAGRDRRIRKSQEEALKKKRAFLTHHL